MEDIEAVNACKPDYIGFVFFPKSKRYVTVEQAAKLKAALDPDIEAVGVFVNEDCNKIQNIAEKNMIDVIQLHGDEDEEMIKYLHRTKKPIIKAVSVRSGKDIDKWKDSSVDFLLFDNGSGGTGETFHWDYIKGYQKPFFLAGGINLSNLPLALEQGAYALDLSGGAETNGVKDPEKIREIIRMVREYSCKQRFQR